MLVTCLGCWLAPTLLQAQAPRPPAAAESLVQGLTHADALLFDGNRAFTKDQILQGLSLRLDFHLAAHPAATLDGYLAQLERLVLRGYQHAGFPQASVKVAAVSNPARLRIAIQEGPRHECGELRLSGAKTMTTDRVRKVIADRLGTSPGVANLEVNLWSVGGWVPYDEPSQQRLRELVLSALGDLGHFQPKVRVTIVPRATAAAADLEVEIADEGIRGVVDEIEISGLRANTRQEVLDYLRLKPGMPLAADLTSRVSTQLWSSARFLHHEVELQPKEAVGRFRLGLDLEELRGVPSLSRELPPEAIATLRFRDWLASWQGRGEDFVCQATVHSPLLQLRLEAALSPTGFVLAGRPDAADRPGSITYAWIATPQLDGLYSIARRRKYAFESGTHRVRVSIRVEPKNIQIAAGPGRASSAEPKMDLEFFPAAFLKAIYRPGAQGLLSNGVLSIRYLDETEGTRLDFRIAAATGRLIEGVMEGKEWRVVLRPEAGSFGRLRDEVVRATADHGNEYDDQHPFSSWLTFMVNDFLEAPWIDPWLRRWSERDAAQGNSNAVVATIRQARSTLALGRDLMGRASFAKVFEPINRLNSSGAGEEDKFFVVPPADASELAGQSSMAPLAAYVLSKADVLTARNTWLWTLLREATFTLVGQGRYTEAELNRLLDSKEVGPVGCLVTGWLLGRVNPKLARTFAERGLSRLSIAPLRQDYRVLFEERSIPADIWANALGSLRGLNQEQATRLTGGLGAVGAALLEQVARLVRENTHAPPARASWPAFERHWEAALKPTLRIELNRFLPQVQFLSDPNALHTRGLALVAPDAVLQDFDEAALCFRKAAEMNHGGAQLQLGVLFEIGQGVRQDYAEAAGWYHKAIERKTPHAACRLGVLYLRGLGVDKDLSQAAKWLRGEAEAGCSGAQFNLGLIYEEQLNMAEALNWYRRAAESGEASAQAHLGDLLSDGFSTKPDYLEACQWLILAAGDTEDRLSQHRLRRAQAKLTAEQLTLAEERAATLKRNIEKQAKEVGKK